jgi:hypothetical protein
MIDPSMNRGVNRITWDKARLFSSIGQYKVPFSNNQSPGAKGQLTFGRLSLYSTIFYSKGIIPASSSRRQVEDRFDASQKSGFHFSLFSSKRQGNKAVVVGQFPRSAPGCAH